MHHPTVKLAGKYLYYKLRMVSRFRLHCALGRLLAGTSGSGDAWFWQRDGRHTIKVLRQESWQLRRLHEQNNA